MRIRFFNTFEPVVPLFTELLPRLARAGHDAHALVSRTDYRLGHRATRLPRRRYLATPLSTASPRSRGLVGGTYASLASLTSLLGRGVHLNVFLTQPPLFPAWGTVLRAARRQRFIQIVMDLYPWVAFAANVLDAGSRVGRLAERVATAGLRSAETVVVIGRCMAREVASLGVEPTRITVIPNWANTEAIRVVPPGEGDVRADYGLQDRFVVLYSGNLGISHDLSDLLRVAARLQGLDDVVFVLIGGGSRREWVRERVAAERLSNVRLLPHLPVDKLSESLAAGDLHFISLRSEFEGLVVPSKAYSALAAGRPILYQGPADSEVGMLVESAAVGAVVEPGNAAALEHHILHARSSECWRRETGRRARELAEGPCSRAAALRAYDQLFEELAASSEAR